MYRLPKNFPHRRFLDANNYLAKSVQINMTSIVRSIHNLVSQYVVWNWGSEQDDAMRCLIAFIPTQHVIAYFDEIKQLVVQSDASKDSL